MRKPLPTDWGTVVWFTGLSGAGKSTLAAATAVRLGDTLQRVHVLDAEDLRKTVSSGLGFSREDRDENIRRIGWVARLLASHGVTVCVAAISPHRDARRAVRESLPPGRFVEIFCGCPRAVLIERDTKGHYRRALAGELANFTGISAPYDVPEQPEVSLDTSATSVEACVEQVLAAVGA